MNRRSFLKVIGITIASPALPLSAPETFTICCKGSPVEETITVRVYEIFRKGRSMDLIMHDEFADTGDWVIDQGWTMDKDAVSYTPPKK